MAFCVARKIRMQRTLPLEDGCLRMVQVSLEDTNSPHRQKHKYIFLFKVTVDFMPQCGII